MPGWGKGTGKETSRKRSFEQHNHSNNDNESPHSTIVTTTATTPYPQQQQDPPQPPAKRRNYCDTINIDNDDDDDEIQVIKSEDETDSSWCPPEIQEESFEDVSYPNEEVRCDFLLIGTCVCFAWPPCLHADVTFKGKMFR